MQSFQIEKRVYSKLGYIMIEIYEKHKNPAISDKVIAEKALNLNRELKHQLTPEKLTFIYGKNEITLYFSIYELE